MENELMQNEVSQAIQQIQVVQGSVVFGAFEELKKQASNLAEQIKTVEVSEDNVKLSKKLLSTVNKRLKELEDKRISIKKLMLEPYQEFEDQVKEIVGIVKDADAIVRDQVNELEQKEREQKHQALKEIFDKRKKMYTYGNLITFDADFFKAKHLNKGTSIESVEKEMVDFLERTEKDSKVIEKMDKNGELIEAYLVTFDLAEAMTLVEEKFERQAQIEQVRKKAIKKETSEEIGYLVSISVHNQKELKLLEMILQEHQFEYTTDKVVL